MGRKINYSVDRIGPRSRAARTFSGRLMKALHKMWNVESNPPNKPDGTPQPKDVPLIKRVEKAIDFVLRRLKRAGLRRSSCRGPTGRPPGRPPKVKPDAPAAAAPGLGGGEPEGLAAGGEGIEKSEDQVFVHTASGSGDS